MKPRLVCRASDKGVLVIYHGRNIFYPKMIGGKFPAKKMTEDEKFIKYCLSGIRHLTPEEIQQLGPGEIEEIIALNKKALTILVHLKAEVAEYWTRSFLKPFLGKRMPTSETEWVDNLIIDDIRDLQLDIEIPRPILFNELLKLKQHVYQTSNHGN